MKYKFIQRSLYLYTRLLGDEFRCSIMRKSNNDKYAQNVNNVMLRRNPARGRGVPMNDTGRPMRTGNVARYCGVSRQGVIRWIQEGRLEAFRTPGGHYRIRQVDFRDFLEEHDIPVNPDFFGDE